MTYQPSERIDRDRDRLKPTSIACERPAFDVASLLELFDGSSEAVSGLLQVAARSIEQDLERIEAATLAGDAAVLAQAAHRLKGTSGSISATRVSGIGSTIERAALAGSSPAAASLVSDLRSAVDAMLAAVESYTSGATRTAVDAHSQ